MKTNAPSSTYLQFCQRVFSADADVSGSAYAYSLNVICSDYKCFIIFCANKICIYYRAAVASKAPALGIWSQYYCYKQREKNER